MTSLEQLPKYYQVEEVVKMLPYLKSYIRDIKYVYHSIKKRRSWDKKLEAFQTFDQDKNKKLERIQDLLVDSIVKKAKDYYRWRDELAEINVFVCSAKYGHLDVPVWDQSTNSVVMLCINTDTSKEHIMWHSALDENYRQSKVYWGYQQVDKKEVSHDVKN